MIQGVYTALITPFRGGKVDEKKLEELMSAQVNARVEGVVACGMTGEFLFLSKEEQKRILEICASICKGKAQLVAGTGALTTEDTIAMTHQATRAGADAVLVLNPWCVKPSQESLYQHYKKVSESVDVPIILYNNPTRTGVEIAVETVVRLAALKNIKAIKDSSQCIQRVSALKDQLGDRFSLLNGNDDMLAAYLAMGGDGGIFVASNVAPSLFADFFAAWKKGVLVNVETIWKKLYPLASTLSLERIKYAMSLVYGTSLESRLPFVPLTSPVRESIESALEKADLWQPLALVKEQ